jgi:GDP/UDP-N,N'-diacetylbacillosamine 2-epimerase (hydrolysing)
MKVAVLTSSRADYGIYLPLLRRLAADPFFELEIWAFGTHLSPAHGYTLRAIEADGFEARERVESLIAGDSPEAIAGAMGLTTLKFAGVWARKAPSLDLAFCLGDRYEMLAAALASTPFGVALAHLHGGEISLGAIDNAFRHSLTQLAQLHFTATPGSLAQVQRMRGSEANAWHVGALSLDNLLEMELLDLPVFEARYGIDLRQPTILFTFHPETVAYGQNEAHAEALYAALTQLPQQVVATMPNADTQGRIIREMLERASAANPRIVLVENFGTLGYFSCMKHCAILLGNSSSGILEAASLGKYVVNLGARQAGRERSGNVIQAPVEAEAILQAAEAAMLRGSYEGGNIYWAGGAAQRIVELLKMRDA